MFTILVPTDFSPCANNALQYALSFAEVFGSQITIFHAFESSDSDLAEPKTKLEQELFQEAKVKLSDLKETITKDYPNISCTTNIEIGYATSSLYRLANTTSYDLIVMGTHGRARTSGREGIPIVIETYFGSISSSLVGEINIPIIAVHENDKFKLPEKFILLSDLQDMSSPDSYKFLTMLAAKFDAKVCILYIENKQRWVSDVFQEMNDIEKLFTGITYEYNVIKEKDIEGTILNMPIDENDFLVVIAKEKSALQSMFGVSMSKELSNYFMKTLLILPEYIAVYPSVE